MEVKAASCSDKAVKKRELRVNEEELSSKKSNKRNEDYNEYWDFAINNIRQGVDYALKMMEQFHEDNEELPQEFSNKSHHIRNNYYNIFSGEEGCLSEQEEQKISNLEVEQVKLIRDALTHLIKKNRSNTDVDNVDGRPQGSQKERERQKEAKRKAQAKQNQGGVTDQTASSKESEGGEARTDDEDLCPPESMQFDKSRKLRMGVSCNDQANKPKKKLNDNEIGSMVMTLFRANEVDELTDLDKSIDKVSQLIELGSLSNKWKDLIKAKVHLYFKGLEKQKAKLEQFVKMMEMATREHAD